MNAKTCLREADRWPVEDIYVGRNLIERIFVPPVSGSTWLGAIRFSTCKPCGFSSGHRDLFRPGRDFRPGPVCHRLQNRGTGDQDSQRHHRCFSNHGSSSSDRSCHPNEFDKEISA
jgi:hypothetical protein